MSVDPVMSSYLEWCKKRLEWCDYTIESGTKCVAGEGLFYDTNSDENITKEEWERRRGHALQHHLDFAAHAREFWLKEIEKESK